MAEASVSVTANAHQCHFTYANNIRSFEAKRALWYKWLCIEGYEMHILQDLAITDD